MIRFCSCFPVFFLLLGMCVRADEKMNVLFVAVDDLRVELACYGQKHVISPNIDALASEGTLFERAYCQQTVCNPSRASVMTGLRPDTLRVWDLPTHFRTTHPDVVTMPQLFMKNGYHSQCVGKIFHNWRQDDWKGDEASWSVPSVLHYNSHANDKPMVDGEVPPNLASGRTGLECRDVPDEAYFDGRVANAAIETLRDLKRKDEPFFFAVGFWKPHTPFNAPKKYWDLYNRDEIPIPTHIEIPVGVPEVALTKDRFDGSQKELLEEMHHGHLAAISYLDAQIGKVLDELEALELRENTIVVFWSDHGLHIGEHGLTRKTTVFELDAGVPLIISVPGLKKGQRTRALAELMDLYPTLADLCELDETPDDLEGESLVPVLHDPASSVREAAMTQTPRPNYLRGKMPEIMGYSIRSDHFRYTEWRDFESGETTARELYDHRSDPLETVNVISEKKFEGTASHLAEKLGEILQGGALDVQRPK
ncbi:MAG: iduronate sulfatase [Verrucomicrobiales bacterium]|nr:iduronate sulfatase [Verrucomicrobiales bacterium]